MSGGESDGAIDGHDGAIDLSRLVHGVVARKKSIIYPTLAAFLAALVFVFAATPKYVGAAKVLLENQERYFTRPDKAVADAGPLIDADTVESQAESVTTIALAKRAIEKLGLEGSAEFDPAKAGGLSGFIGSLLRGGSKPRIVDEFLSHLTAFAVPRSHVVQIEFSSRDPDLAARGANTAAQLFLESLEAAKQATAKSAGAWLAKKITELREKVAETDAEVEKYRADAGLLGGSNNMTGSSQQLAELNTQLSAAKSARASAMGKAQVLRAMLRDGRLDETPQASKDESLRKYAEQRVTLKEQIALESRTLLPGHPRMKELAGQLAQLDAEIRSAAAKTVRALEDEARIAGAQAETVAAELDRQSKKVASGNADQVKLRALELDNKTARDQLESYISKYREAAARDAEHAEPADARIISAADEPRSPTFPKKLPTLLLATLAAFVCALGVSAASELMSSSTTAGARAPASLRPIEPVRARDSMHFSMDDVVDQLARASGGDRALTALIVGQAEGTALSASLSIARRLSERDDAILVDIGRTQSWFADILDHSSFSGAAAGLCEALDGRAPIENAIHRDLSSHLDVIPFGLGEPSSAGLPAVLDALTGNYAFVVLHVSDWRDEAFEALVEKADVIVVAAAQDSAGDVQRRLEDAIGDGGPPILTLVSGDVEKEAEALAA